MSLHCDYCGRAPSEPPLGAGGGASAAEHGVYHDVVLPLAFRPRAGGALQDWHPETSIVRLGDICPACLRSLEAKLAQAVRGTLVAAKPR